jgi:hypothetical protein
MSKYKLGDYTVQNWNDWDRVPRDPVTVGAAILQAVAPAFVAGLSGAAAIGLAYAVGYIAITAVTSWALKALTPKPDFGALDSSGILVNRTAGIAPQDFIYGQVRKGGIVTFYETTGSDNVYLHQIICLAGHEVNSIGDIYINDQIATFSGDFVTTAGTGSEQVNWDSKVRIKKYDGSQTTADSDLVSETSATSSFKGLGIAYLYVRYEYDQDIFPNGLPTVTAVVQGKKVYDPRTASTGYSSNAALCIRDFLTSSYGLTDSAIDDVSFSAAANECDENVSLDGGGTEKRYALNGIVQANRSVGDVLGDMVTACAGTLFWGSGYWKLKAGAYSSPVKTLTLDDLRSPIALDTRITMRDNFNTVRGTFIDASQGWISADYPEVTGAAFVTEDNGEQALLDLQLPFTTSSATAQRLAKLTLYRGREQMTFSADFGLEALEVEVGDIIGITNARYGFNAKEFEVVGWRFSSDQDAGDLRVNLTLRETSAAAFNWNAEETDIISNNTTLPSITAGTAITNLTLSDGGSEVQGDGTVINSLLASWTAPTNAFVSYYEVELRQTSSANTTVFTTSETSIVLSPVIDGVNYTVRVRSVSVTGFRGAYASASATAGGDTSAPSAPTSVSASGGFKYITVNWTNPANRDLNFVEIYENSSNTTSGATVVGTSSGSAFVRTNLGINVTKYYFLKAVDFSGNKSGFTSGVTATTDFIDNADFENGVRQLFIDQGLDIIEPVSSLPAAGDFAGQQVFLTTNGKLYRWTGSAWVLTIAASDAGDLTGQITGTQISDNAITAPKISANTITGNKIVANTITGGLLSTSGIITSAAQINDGLITNAKIGNAAINAAKIQDGQVTNAKIGNTIQSTNYSAGSSGWRILKSGAAEFNGVVLSRQLMVDSGTFTASAFTCNANSSFDIDKTYNLEATSVPISAWSGTNFTYLATAGLSNVAAFGTTSQIPNIFWGVRTVVLPLTRWSGNQTLRLRFEIWGKYLTGMGNVSDTSYPPSGNFNINWKIYKVT